ncbi:hypothetical protein [Rhodococcus tukisamuensis]|uniref:hypothetical protein n=1 Tax=Rhodococcus tukisamuensis TaxID=168276 RepID=UPI000932A802|nr:hypothetical protein [Rhodococcus tukisamuensis]
MCGPGVAISAAARMDVPSTEFYVAAARALVDGLGRAGTGRERGGCAGLFVRRSRVALVDEAGRTGRRGVLVAVG